MLEVTFDIPTIKKLEPKLYEHFGFTLDDILYELNPSLYKEVNQSNTRRKRNRQSNVKLKNWRNRCY